MYRIVLFSLLLTISHVSFGISVTQTDWSGAGGVQGPVNDWGSTFYQSSFVNFSIDRALQLGILPNLTEHIPDINTSAGMKFALWGDIDMDGDIDLLEVTADDIILWHEQPSAPGTWPTHYCASPGEVISVELVKYEASTPLWVVDYNNNGTATVNLYTYTSGCFYIGELGDADYGTGVSSGDIDGNGTTDIIGWKWGFDEICVWWSCSSDSMELLLSPHTPVWVFVFDGDGDGDSELAVAKSWYPETVVYWNNGSSWGSSTLPDLFYAYGIDSGDIDGDGLRELTAVTYSTQMLFKKSGSSWTGETLTGGPDRCAFTDLDGDFDTDVIGFGGTSFHFFYNCDHSGNLFYADYDVGFSGNRLECADMNLDGHENLILTETSTGQIRWYEHFATNQSTGSLESSILDLGSDLSWGSIDWNAETPEGTSVSFLVRASDDYTVMGAWSDTLFSPCSLRDILSENDSYFQYKTVLSTSDPDTTPTLNDVTVSWDPMSIEENDFIPPYTALLHISPNPVAGTVQIRFNLQDASPVKIVLFDITGRKINTVLEEERPAGSHSVHLNTLTPGIYFCRMTSVDIIATQRFVVIE